MLPAVVILLITCCVAYRRLRSASRHLSSGLLYCINSIRQHNISISQYLNIEKAKNIISVTSLLIITSSFIITEKAKPTLYIIGDSTVRNTNRPQCGWGEMIGDFFDTTQISISNQAIAGRSTRTFIKEKRWDKILSTLKPGDYVIMQFGHNEGSKPDTSRAGYRGVLRGTGDETVDLLWKDSTVETVHTYGWYLKKFVNDAKARNAIPIICSMIPRNQFIEGKVKRADQDFGKWAKEVAESTGAYFIDLNRMVADIYDARGVEEVKKFFYGDHTHTNKIGASLNAGTVVQGIRLLKQLSLNNYLKNNPPDVVF